MAKVEWERTIEVGKIAFSGLFGDSLSFKKREIQQDLLTQSFPT